MRYTLRRLVLGELRFIELSEDEFTTLEATQEKLLVVLDIEGTFDLLLETYAEFERDFLGLNLRLSLFGERGEPLETYREMNCRIANLLSSACLYIDQVPHNLHAIYGKRSNRALTFKQWCSEQYDSSFAYGVMEALRDYAQHRGFPVHAITLNFEREGPHPGSLVRAGLWLFIELQRLKEDRRCKKTVLNDLTAIAGKRHVDLTPLVREYVDKLCETHKSLRGLISANISSWDQTIISVLDRGRSTFGNNLAGLCIAVEEAEREGDEEYYRVIDSTSIWSEPIDWRKRLESKNRDFGNLSAQYVTGHTGH
jgi:hypothetical protein